MATSTHFPGDIEPVLTHDTAGGATLLVGAGAQNFAAQMAAAPSVGVGMVVNLEATNFAVVNGSVGINMAATVITRRVGGTVVVVCT